MVGGRPRARPGLRLATLPPYCPKCYGNIAKIKAEDMNAIYEANFDIAQLSDKNKGTRSTPPSWSAVERSPEAGAAKRDRAAAAEAARRAMNGVGFEVDEAGTIWYRTEEIIKFNTKDKEWIKTRCWNLTQGDHNWQWGTVKKALDAEL